MQDKMRQAQWCPGVAHTTFFSDVYWLKGGHCGLICCLERIFGKR